MKDLYFFLHVIRKILPKIRTFYTKKKKRSLLSKRLSKFQKTLQVERECIQIGSKRLLSSHLVSIIRLFRFNRIELDLTVLSVSSIFAVSAYDMH